MSTGRSKREEGERERAREGREGGRGWGRGRVAATHHLLPSPPATTPVKSASMRTRGRASCGWRSSSSTQF